MAKRIVDFLLTQDYVSGLFVDSKRNLSIRRRAVMPTLAAPSHS
jgi:hypothetical protein